MRLSQTFTKTRKETPKGERARNAQLLIRAGYVHKEMAGVYSYLPLGLKVLKKISDIIREEMNAIDGQELLLTTLQEPEVWRASGRWVEEEADPKSGLPWFKTKLVNGTELGIGNTHEEVLANIMTQHVSSHKDLPVYVYQIQNKFRNELRAKSGLMRGREFLMKDLYSFTATEEELVDYYERAAEAYKKIFDRVGIGELTYRTFASGGAFSKFSDEFQTLSEAGEDTIYLDKKKKIAVNKEVYNDKVLKELSLNKDDLQEARSIEVGNIFKLGTRYSEALGLTYKDSDGAEHPVVMGSYGIGIGRVMGAVVEVTSDDKGLVWPESIAPAQVHLLNIGEDKQVREAADKLYQELTQVRVDVIYDDRAESAGTKLADADLLGVPQRVVVSNKTLESGSAELKARAATKTELVKVGKVAQTLKK